MADALREILRIAGSPEQMLGTLTLLIAAGSVVISIVLRALGVHRSGLAIPIAVLVALSLSPFRSPGMLIVIVPFALGFMGGMSTRVQRYFDNPFDTEVLDPVDYGHYQERLLKLKSSRELARFAQSTSIPSLAKMGLMMQIRFASFYRGAPLIALGLSIAYVWFWALAHTSDERRLAVQGLVFLMSFPYGSAMGRLVTYIRAHAPARPSHGDVLSPTLKSLAASIAAPVFFTILAALTPLFMPAARMQLLTMRVALIGIVLMNLTFIVQAIFVHRAKLILLDDGFLIWRRKPAGGCRWADLRRVTIRERGSWFRKDRLLKFERNDGEWLAYVTSILSPADERKFLNAVRRFVVNTETVLDKSAY